MVPSVPSAGGIFQNASNVIIQGAYEDFNGDVVIYGSCDVNNINYPVAALYDITLQQIKNFNLDMNHPGDYFINGCCGYDLKKTMVNMMTLENAGVVVPIEWNCSPHNINVLEDANQQGLITDVLWDSYNNCFAAAGHRNTLAGIELFLLKFEYDASISNPIVTTSIVWELPNYMYAEYRTNLEILNGNDIVVGQCVRGNNSDWIYLSKIHNYTTVLNPTIFMFPVPKVSMLDMKYDENAKRLTILGEWVYCDRVNYIAQVNPTLMSGMNAIQVVGNKPYIICMHNTEVVCGSDIVLQKLEKNSHDCDQIIATGTWKDRAYITEAYDIANILCDIPVNISDQPAPPQPGVFAYNTPSLNIIRSCTPIPLMLTGLLQENYSCQDFYPCTKNEEDSVKNMFFSNDKMEANIVEKGDGVLEFIGFTGKINYIIYDAVGRMVANGIVENKFLKHNLHHSGLYIISAKDQSGNSVTKKFVYTHE